MKTLSLYNCVKMCYRTGFDYSAFISVVNESKYSSYEIQMCGCLKYYEKLKSYLCVRIYHPFYVHKFFYSSS